MKQFLLLTGIVILFAACKKDDDTITECIPLPVVYDPNFVIIPYTGVWVNYYKNTTSIQYDTLRLGSPKLFTLTTHITGVIGNVNPITRAYYPLIKKRHTLNTNTQNVYIDIDTIAYIREDTAQKKLYRVQAITPFDSAKYEYLMFDYALQTGDTIDFYYYTNYGDQAIVVGVDSIYAFNRYLKRTYFANEYGKIITNVGSNPNIQGLNIGSLNAESGNWSKLIYNGEEFKITFRAE